MSSAGVHPQNRKHRNAHKLTSVRCVARLAVSCAGLMVLVLGRSPMAASMRAQSRQPQENASRAITQREGAIQIGQDIARRTWIHYAMGEDGTSRWTEARSKAVTYKLVVNFDAFKHAPETERIS